jgi:hypothetical protein
MYICYSVCRKERAYTEIMLEHMESMGLAVREKEIDKASESTYPELCEAVEKSSGVIVLLTEGLLTDIEVLVELDVIKRMFEKKGKKVITLSYGINQLQLPKRLQWLGSTKFFMMENEEDIGEGISFAAKESPESRVRDMQLKVQLQIAERCVSFALSELAKNTGSK